MTDPLPTDAQFSNSPETAPAESARSSDPLNAGDEAGSSPDGVVASGETGEGQTKRRRRRRRRGKGKAGAAPAGTEASQTEDGDADVEDDGPDDAPETSHDHEAEPAAPEPRAEQPARQRSGRSGGRGKPAPAPAGHHHSHDGDNAEHAPREERRADRAAGHGPKVSAKDWEEVFEGQTFADLGLRSSVLKGIEAQGFTNPTKIQAALIPLVIAGKDVLGQSRTGTGKTAAFGLPLFHCAQREVPFQSLVLAPTRELAIQIATELSALGKFTPIRVSAVYGGQNVGAQAKQLDRGPEIVVATPGRLMDMVERRHLHLNNVRFAILDEVDRMLDIGFRDDIRKILGGIKNPHQTIFVSATISGEIEKLARQYMKDPEKLVTAASSLTVSLVEQHYIAVEPWDKRPMLLHLLTHEEPDLTVIFCRTKRTVDDLARYLCDKGIDAHPMHGDMYQGKRNSVMKRLRAGELSVLVASDLAARGLDVDGVSHVVNYDLPEDPEVYIHRIGRTARAGRRGVAWALVTPEQGALLTEIEKLANTHIPERKYPAFKPGPVPSDVRARRESDSRRAASRPTINRSAPPALPAAATEPRRQEAGNGSTAAPAPLRVVVDLSKFPGGIVPTKLPPKRMGGKVKSARAIKAAVAADAAGIANAAQPAPAEAQATTD